MMINTGSSVRLDEVAEMVRQKIDVACLTRDSYVSTENMIPDRGGVIPAEALPPSGRVNRFLIGDTLFSNIRTYFKKVWLADHEGGASADVIIFRPILRDQLDSAFLFYLLSSDAFIDSTVTASKGTKMPRGDKEAMLHYSIDLPLLPMQQRIVSILSAYDELIENSLRRIKILETMARALYREWFVNFKFPGHEKHLRIASSLGDIPKNWEVKTVADSFEISGGGTPSRKEAKYWEDGTIQWFSPSDLTGSGTMFMDDSSDHITELGLAESSARLFPARSVMLTSRATIGAIAINTHEACTNQGFITCMPNERVPLFFLFHWLTENVPTFQRMASGATFKEISRGVFKTIEFLQPPVNLVRRYEDVAAPMAEQALILQRQIQNLRRTRDLLLPRLLSGELRLSVPPFDESLT
jgi:type I restriction enzyme, S subunit